MTCADNAIENKIDSMLEHFLLEYLTCSTRHDMIVTYRSQFRMHVNANQRVPAITKALLLNLHGHHIYHIYPYFPHGPGVLFLH